MSNRTEPNASEAPPRIVRTVIDIAAPPAHVFETLTDPRELAAWWGGGDARTLDCESDARPGGAWRVRTLGPDGAERTVGGGYRVVDAPHRLEQTWQATDDAAPSLVRYDLEPLQVDGTDGTRLTVTHTSPTALAISASAAAWTDALPTLAALVERIRETRARPAAGRRVDPVWCHAPRRPAWARAALARLP